MVSSWLEIPSFSMETLFEPAPETLMASWHRGHVDATLPSRSPFAAPLWSLRSGAEGLRTAGPAGCEGRDEANGLAGLRCWVFGMFWVCRPDGYGSIPINTIFSGMNIHLAAILGFTRYQGFDPSPDVFDWLMTVQHSVETLKLKPSTYRKMNFKS